jgi:hypothetical protein
VLLGQAECFTTFWVRHLLSSAIEFQPTSLGTARGHWCATAVIPFNSVNSFNGSPPLTSALPPWGVSSSLVKVSMTLSLTGWLCQSGSACCVHGFGPSTDRAGRRAVCLLVCLTLLSDKAVYLLAVFKFQNLYHLPLHSGSQHGRNATFNHWSRDTASTLKDDTTELLQGQHTVHPETIPERYTTRCCCVNGFTSWTTDSLLQMEIPI